MLVLDSDSVKRIKLLVGALLTYPEGGGLVAACVLVPGLTAIFVSGLIATVVPGLTAMVVSMVSPLYITGLTASGFFRHFLQLIINHQLSPSSDQTVLVFQDSHSYL